MRNPKNQTRTTAVMLIIACVIGLALTLMGCMISPHLGWIWLMPGLILLIALIASIILAIHGGPGR